MKAFFVSLDRSARIGLGIGALVLALLTAGGLWWALAPEQQLLFGNLREADAAEIVKALDEWKVPHAFVDGGAGITVPADQVYETRMKLVSEGVPRGGHVGFELFDDSDFGVTEFAQRINYQRALQGEIERTISSLPAVADARVHLTIRKPGLFVGDQEGSKASVALTLRPGEALERGQVNGIRSLVAAAVEGLDVAQVTILDSDGSLLAGPRNGASPGLDERGEEEARLESAIQGKVSTLLAQVLRSDQYKVSVDVALDFDAVREVSERPIGPDGSGDAMLLRKRTNSDSAADGDGADRNEEESEFVHGTARREVSRAPGRIERLSVAVILPPTLDDFDMPRLRDLIAAAAGIDPTRGDRLEVSRIGPEQAVRIGPEPVIEETSAAPVAGARRAAAAATPAWQRWLPALAIGLLLGTIVAFAAQRRPRALRASEREAALERLRAWLGEGGAA